MIDFVMLLRTAAIFILGMFAGYYFRIDRFTVRDYERGLLFRNGKFRGEVGPGKHLLGWNSKINIIDMRQENYFVSQNILTSDNIIIGININVRTKVADAHKAFTSSQDFRQDTHDISRSVIKEAGRKTKTRTILKNEEFFERRLTNRLVPRLKEIGMELVNIELIDAHIPHSVQESIADSLDDLVNKKEDKKTKHKVGFLKE